MSALSARRSIGLVLLLSGVALVSVSGSAAPPLPGRCQISMPPDGYLRPAKGSTDLKYLRPLQHVFAAEAFARGTRSEQVTSADLPELRELLLTAGFRPLTNRDIALSNALNHGYLYRLSLAARLQGQDETLAAEFDPLAANETRLFGGSVVLWCRGNGAEISSGRLLFPKLDYLQAALVQRSASAVARAILRVRARLGYTAERASRALRSGHARALASLGLSRAADVADGAGGSRRPGPERAPESGAPAALAERLRSPVQDLEDHRRRQLPLGRYGAWLAASDPAELLRPFLAASPAGPDPGPGSQPAGGASEPDELGSAGATPAPALPPTERVIDRVSLGDLLEHRAPGPRPGPGGQRAGTPAAAREGLLGRSLALLLSRQELREPTFGELVAVWRSRPAPPRRRRLPRPLRLLAVQLPRLASVVSEHFDIRRQQQSARRRPGAGDGRGREQPQPEQPQPAPSASGVGASSGADSGAGAGEGGRACELLLLTQVPMANFRAVLPGNILVFGPAEALRLDLVTIASLLVLLLGGSLHISRVGRCSLLLLWLARTLFNYRNALVRYDLLVNRFLQLHLGARGRGVLQLLRAEAAAQSALRASLVLAWLERRAADAPGSRGVSEQALRDDVPRMVRAGLGCAQAVRFPTERTVRELQRLGLVSVHGAQRVVRLSPRAQLAQLLEAHWRSLLQPSEQPESEDLPSTPVPPDSLVQLLPPPAAPPALASSSPGPSAEGGEWTQDAKRRVASRAEAADAAQSPGAIGQKNSRARSGIAVMMARSRLRFWQLRGRARSESSIARNAPLAQGEEDVLQPAVGTAPFERWKPRPFNFNFKQRPSS